MSDFILKAPNGFYIARGPHNNGADGAPVPNFEVRGGGGGPVSEGWITLDEAVIDLCSTANCDPEELVAPNPDT
jgi:hypothetical protein